MKLYHQLILFVGAATTIPLLIGLVVLRHNENQLQSHLLGSQRDSAKKMAEIFEGELQEILERLRKAMGYLQLDETTPEELDGLLRILYKQSESIVQVAILNESGNEIIPGVFLENPELYRDYAGRIGVTKKGHEKFLQQLPLAKALQSPEQSIIVGQRYQLSPGGVHVISVTIPWQLRDTKARWLAAIEISLEKIIKRIAEAGTAQKTRTFLVDSEGKIIDTDESFHNAPGIGSLNLADLVRNLASHEGESNGAMKDGDNLIGYSLVSWLDWGVVTVQSQNEAWMEVRSARRLTVAWTSVSILALLVLGGVFTSRITKNLRQFVSSAEEFSKGNLKARVILRTKDELGRLAETFNKMGEELELSRCQIEEWNRELSSRVEQRTRELEITHRRLLETSKLAAIGQLGAGVAHEINNPLAAILGNVQLLLLKLRETDEIMPTLKKMEASAIRCREITQNLLRFSEAELERDPVEVDLNAILKDAFSLTEQRMKAQHIEIVWKLDGKLPHVLGDHRQLMQVFFNLFSNARTAMEEGGTLTISTQAINSKWIETKVGDTGKGIPPEYLDRIFEPFFTTKDVWTNTGLGLSVVYRTVSDHGGQISVESELGKGSVFRILLPFVGDWV